MGKTIFIIGAGMSAECDAPVISTFLKPQYLQLISQKQKKEITDFLKSGFFSGTNITIEDALKKIDTVIDSGISSFGYSSEQLEKVRTILVDYIMEILSVCGDNLLEELRATKLDDPYYVLTSPKKNQEKKYKTKIIHQLIRELENFSGYYDRTQIIGINAQKWLETYFSILFLMKPNDVVINLNYDQFFELAILDLPQDVLIDYGTDYYRLSTDEDILGEGYLPQVTRPLQFPDERKISLLKIHGSLNWGICSGCNSLIFTNRTPIPRLKKYFQKLQKTEAKFKKRYLCCTHFTIKPLIVIPTIYAKRGYENKYLTEISQSAITEISNADNLVFLGYTLSESDLFVRNIFENALKNRKETPWKSVVVVNRSIESLKGNYEKNFKNAEFCKSNPSVYIQEKLREINFKKCTTQSCIMKNKPINWIKI